MRIYYIKVSVKLFCLFTGQKEYNSIRRGLMLHISSFYGGSTVHISFYLWSGKRCKKKLRDITERTLVLFRQVQCTAKIIIMVIERDSEVLMTMTLAMTINLSIRTL